MSLTTMHMIDKVTVWTPTTTGDETNPYNPPTITWSVETLSCEFESGGRAQRDDTGAEFQPMTTIYTASGLTKGSKIKIGEFTDSTPPADAEDLRKVGAGTSLRGQPPEYVGWTS